jgi:hypothetical protein
MFTPLTNRGPHSRVAARKAAARLRRLAALLAALTCGLLASAAVIPAAFANPIPIGDQPGPSPAAPVPATIVRVVTAVGMPGWQITLIAAGAAILAALLAVTADRARAARRHTTAPSL